MDQSKLPELDAGDMPDPRQLSAKELALVPAEEWRLFCGIKGCSHYTRVKDFGIWPLLHGRFAGRWININVQRFLCARHWKIYRDPGHTEIPYKETVSLDTVRKTIMEEK